MVLVSFGLLKKINGRDPGVLGRETGRWQVLKPQDEIGLMKSEIGYKTESRAIGPNTGTSGLGDPPRITPLSSALASF